MPDKSQPELEEERVRHGIPYAFDSAHLCLGVGPLTVWKLLQFSLVSHHVELRCQALHFMMQQHRLGTAATRTPNEQSIVSMQCRPLIRGQTSSILLTGVATIMCQALKRRQALHFMMQQHRLGTAATSTPSEQSIMSMQCRPSIRGQNSSILLTGVATIMPISVKRSSGGMPCFS